VDPGGLQPVRARHRHCARRQGRRRRRIVRFAAEGPQLQPGAHRTSAMRSRARCAEPGSVAVETQGSGCGVVVGPWTVTVAATPRRASRSKGVEGASARSTSGTAASTDRRAFTPRCAWSVASGRSQAASSVSCARPACQGWSSAGACARRRQGRAGRREPGRTRRSGGTPCSNGESRSMHAYGVREFATGARDPNGHACLTWPSWTFYSFAG